MDLAEYLGVTRRAATKLLSRAAKDRPWRGRRLEVRRIFGQGGKSGLLYQVSLSSLSEALEEPLTAPPPPVILHPFRYTAAAPQAVEQAERFGAIECALPHPKGTRERTAAIRTEAAKGRHSERTLYRWLDLYERHGAAGLARKLPADAGKARVIVSRQFDAAYRAAGYANDGLAELGGLAATIIKGGWKSRSGLQGWSEVRQDVEQALWEACGARGVSLPAPVFRLPRNQIELHRHYSTVALRKYDRKAYHDTQPRVRRDWTVYAPMEIVIADVKHLDVVLTRPDGSRAWPKIVAFMDGGTGRVFAYPVLLPVGEGVRQEHVLEALLAMVEDERWGFPSALYLDNGSEFKILDRLTPALSLVASEGARTVIHARPYNAAAKPIESAFSRLDRSVFSKFPGYVGGNRMAQKTQNVGKAADPYPGSFETFCDQMQAMFHSYNATPRAGQWGGQSPNDWLRQKIDGGWVPVRVRTLELDSAFCAIETRRVGKVGLKIDGAAYFHPELPPFVGRDVTVALPWRRNAAPLFQLPGGGWRQLAADDALPALSKDGAQEAGRRQKARDRAVTVLDRAVPELDNIGLRIRYGERHPAAVPRGRADRLDTGGELKALADERANAPKQQAAQLTIEDQTRARRDAHTRRLQGKQSNVA